MRKTSALLIYVAALMLTPQFALAAPGAVIVMTPAATIKPASDSGTCYNIQDPDARAYCLAKARRDASVCYSVQRADLRSLCLAEVRR